VKLINLKKNLKNPNCTHREERNTDVSQGELLKLKKNGKFLDDPVRMKGAQIHHVISQTYYL
jgi:hypothetical protein